MDQLSVPTGVPTETLPAQTVADRWTRTISRTANRPGLADSIDHIVTRLAPSVLLTVHMRNGNAAFALAAILAGVCPTAERVDDDGLGRCRTHRIVFPTAVPIVLVWTENTSARGAQHIRQDYSALRPITTSNGEKRSA